MSQIIRQAAERKAICEAAYALHYGNAATVLVRVVPDAVFPGMWRMHWPDGSISDMGNLSRIRDAAVVICTTPERNSRLFCWKKQQHERRQEAPLVPQMGSGGLREPRATTKA